MLLVLMGAGLFFLITVEERLKRRKALAARPSVRAAVSADYPALLRDFLDRRNSWLSGLQARAAGLGVISAGFGVAQYQR